MLGAMMSSCEQGPMYLNVPMLMPWRPLIPYVCSRCESARRESFACLPGPCEGLLVLGHWSPSRFVHRPTENQVVCCESCGLSTGAVRSLLEVI